MAHGWRTAGRVPADRLGLTEGHKPHVLHAEGLGGGLQVDPPVSRDDEEDVLPPVGLRDEVLRDPVEVDARRLGGVGGVDGLLLVDEPVPDALLPQVGLQIRV
jgi:hypothetical protein